MTALIKTIDICKSFPGVKALSNVCIEFREEEVHAVVGENGAGKTTLMRVICGIYQPDSGEILLNNEPVIFQNPRMSQDSGIAIIHQELNMPVNLSIAQYIYLGRTPTNKFGIVKKKNEINDSFDILKLVDVHRHPYKIYDLTVAEQQLVKCQSALTNSRLLIMDEPTSALNKQETANLFEIIRSLKSREFQSLYLT